MIALSILDIKDTMAQLLLQEEFDNFFLEEVHAVTYASIKINGRRNMDWYDSEQREEGFPRLLFWREIKPSVFQLIKGKKPPSFFSVMLKLCPDGAERYLEDSGVLQMVKTHQIDLFLHFRFEKGKLSLVTGISQKEFIIDKMAEHTWDLAVKQLLKRLKISYEE